MRYFWKLISIHDQICVDDIFFASSYHELNHFEVASDERPYAMIWADHYFA